MISRGTMTSCGRLWPAGLIPIARIRSTSSDRAREPGAQLAPARRMLAPPARIAGAAPSDRPTVLTLLAEHTPGTDVARRHAWLYESNPHGPAVTFLAYDEDGTPMGLTSLFPRRVLVKGEVRIGSIG